VLPPKIGTPLEAAAAIILIMGGGQETLFCKENQGLSLLFLVPSGNEVVLLWKIKIV